MKPLKTRTQARRAAFKALFEIRVRGADSLADRLATLEKRDGDTDLRDFARTLVTGVADRGDELQAMIRTHATNWDPQRIAQTDRVVLEMALFEMNWLGQPAAVAIDEAVELARRYGSAESPAFVNGVLDSWNRNRG